MTENEKTTGGLDSCGNVWLRYVESLVEAYNQGDQLVCALKEVSPSRGDWTEPLGCALKEVSPSRGDWTEPLGCALKDLPSDHKSANDKNTEPERTRKIVICSPHPDDEALICALPLRLMREDRVAVVNVALTLGSDPARKEERRQEMARACGVLGFEYRLVEEPLAFDRITPTASGHAPAGRGKKIEVLADLFAKLAPDLVFCPHEDDLHPTHIWANHLVIKALKKYSEDGGQDVILLETEYWHPMKDPDLLVAASPKEVALMIEALCCHRGEIDRNPYHLRLAARLMDNVRRGGELVGGFGRRVPDFIFGELYRISLFSSGVMCSGKENLVIGPDQKISCAALEKSVKVCRVTS
ncbi:MAG: PIG-L family deacetylase [Proteobacteria bacterium]|nr:PIG-L family deacetylase [Pseudomonadota bacterium]MBU1715964.1 PIG-L family deacetylase [Pseudomonadota bacterium]